ncbi:MAG: isopentenyl transferase family protein [Clostridia bacterium]|nr:isopentenyl transferase family protein [Clostridia bacterium]
MKNNKSPVRDFLFFYCNLTIIGPIGSGKSFVADKLSEITGMAVVSLDVLKTCPKTVEDIAQNKRQYILSRGELRKKRAHCKNFLEVMSLNKEIAELDKKIKKCNKQVEMREFLPDVHNYYEMGYKDEVSSFIKDTYGEVACSFYHKQFEIRLLREVVKNLPYACILNIGGTIPICLEEQYSEYANMFKDIDNRLFYRYFDESQLSFDNIKSILGKFENVVEFKLPKDYKDKMKRAKASVFNTYALNSNQYAQLAKYSIEVDGLIMDDNYNENVAEQIAKSIETK